MRFDTLDDIRAAGFVGFQSVVDLRATSLARVPAEAGVYLVLRPKPGEPEFLEHSPAGRPKDKDPSVSIERLEASWVSATPVIYIGKAGGTGIRSSLRSRLRAYLSHGAGRRSPHWGGRYIWQLADSDELLVAWRPTPSEEPRDVERGMISGFESRWGARPFANRIG